MRLLEILERGRLKLNDLDASASVPALGFDQCFLGFIVADELAAFHELLRLRVEGDQLRPLHPAVSPD